MSRHATCLVCDTPLDRENEHGCCRAHSPAIREARRRATRLSPVIKRQLARAAAIALVANGRVGVRLFDEVSAQMTQELEEAA